MCHATLHQQDVQMLCKHNRGHKQDTCDILCGRVSQCDSMRSPEHNVSSLVGLPCLDQCEVSGDGFLHDVLPAVELLHLCTGKSQLVE